MRKLKVIVGGLALATVPIVSMGVASAGNPSLCASSRVCIYADKNFSGLLGTRLGGGGLVTVPVSDNDKMTSYENRSSTYNARWYTNAGGGGKCLNMTKGTQDNDVSWNDDNMLSSWATDHGC